jgi:DNA modification methylase
MVDLRLGDCLELMADIPNQSVDMILCDLPYGVTACKWDVVIPFEPLWAHYKRIIKKNGAIVLTATQPFTSMLVMSNREWFRYEWIWEKDRATGFLDANKKPLRCHEQALVFSQRMPCYNPQKTELGVKVNTPGKRTSDNLYHLLRENLEVRTTGGQTDRYPRTVVKFNVPNGAERGFHPTQKPVPLGEYLIRTYTKEGETVLDNTMGSGSFGVAAVNTNRDFIGMELDPGYFDTAKRRIDEALQKRAGDLL